MTCPQCQSPLQAQDTFCQECGSPNTRARQDPLIGKNLLGQYIVKRRIGEGGFGAVYEAEQPSMQRKIAIKTLHSYLAKRPSIVARFRREGLAASKLNHPAAVKMYNLGETEDGTLWLSMEFIEGKSLDAKIKESPLSLTDVRRIIVPICEVLAEAHQKGIIHRDLKPQNIMLPDDTSGAPCKLLDFGLASLLEGESITREGVISGTPAYMAPEQWEGLSRTDARTDLYALGAILYYGLSGVLPLMADSTPEWVTKHTKERPIPLDERAKNIPSQLSQVAMKALEKNPENRYQTAQEMKQAILRALEPPVVTLPPSPLPAAQVSHISVPELPVPAPRFVQSSRKKLLWAGVLVFLLFCYAYAELEDGDFIPAENASASSIIPSEYIKQAATAADYGNYDQALSMIEEIKRADPSFAKAYLLEGSVYQLKAELLINQNDAQGFVIVAKSCESYKRYIQLEPYAPEIPNLQIYMSATGTMVKECRMP